MKPPSLRWIAALALGATAAVAVTWGVAAPSARQRARETVLLDRSDPAKTVLRPKVLVIVHDPLVPAEGNRPLSQVCGWNDPAKLAQGYADDLRQAA